LNKFHNGVRNIAAIGLKIGYPTVASVPHSVARGYKNILSVSLATDYTFDKAQKIKDYLKNPGAFAASAPAPAKGKDAAPAKAAEKAPVKEAPKEESDGDMGFGLFD